MIKKDSAATSSAAFDPQRLRDIFDGDVQAMREVVAEAVESLQQIHINLEAQLRAGGNPDAIAALLHELKGVSGNVGGTELHEISAAILEEARVATIVPTEKFADLQSALTRFVAAAQVYVAK